MAANGVTLHRKDAVQDKAFAENSRFSQTAPPGFAAAAAAAAVAAADAGIHTPTPRSAAAAAELAAARAGTRPATPWPTAAANAGAAAGADALPATPRSTYATQPYIQPMIGGNSSMTQAHHPSMTLHYMPGHGNLLPFVHGHGAPPQTMTRMPPPQPLLPPQPQMQPPHSQAPPPHPQMQPPPSQAPPPPPQRPPPPLPHHWAVPTIRCVPSDRLTMPRVIPRMISNDMPRGQMGHLLPMMPSQDRRQFPAFRATTPSGQAGANLLCKIIQA